MRLKILVTVLLLVALQLTGWTQTTQTLKVNPLLEGYIGLDGKPYEPMTDEQVKAWLKTITPEQLFSEIRKLDLIEHVKPTIGFPDLVVGTTKNDSIILGWADPGAITIDVAGQLNYTLKLEPKEFKGLAKKDSTLKIIISIIATAAVSSLVEFAMDQVGISKSSPLLGIGISVAGGGLVGGLIYVCWPEN